MDAITTSKILYRASWWIEFTMIGMTRQSRHRQKQIQRTSLLYVFILCDIMSTASKVFRPTFAFLNKYQRRRSGTPRSITTTIQTLYHNTNIIDGGIFTSLFSSTLSKEEVDPGDVDGTDLRIVKYPNPSLRSDNAEVILPEDEESVKKLAKDMLKVMYAAEVLVWPRRRSVWTNDWWCTTQPVIPRSG